MSFFHFSCTTVSKKGTIGTKTKARGVRNRRAAAAKNHYDYITRQSRYKSKEGLIESCSGNLPSWAADHPGEYWYQADFQERQNGRLYQNIEFALPIGVSREEQRRIVDDFVLKLTHHDKFDLPFSWAIHDDGHNPHCHLMISERIPDGVDRDPLIWFRRANKKEPKKGGAAKTTILQRKQFVAESREALAIIINQSLERSGIEMRVDSRTLKEQGIDRPPQFHFGPTVMAMVDRHAQSHMFNLYRLSVIPIIEEEKEKQLIELNNRMKELEDAEREIDRQIQREEENARLEQEKKRKEKEEQERIEAEREVENSINQMPGFFGASEFEDEEFNSNLVVKHSRRGFSYRAMEDENGRNLFVVFKNRIAVNTENEDAILIAMKIGMQKWGSISVTGSEDFITTVVRLAAENNIALNDPKLAERALAIRKKAQTESQSYVRERDRQAIPYEKWRPRTELIGPIIRVENGIVYQKIGNRVIGHDLNRIVNAWDAITMGKIGMDKLQRWIRSGEKIYIAELKERSLVYDSEQYEAYHKGRTLKEKEQKLRAQNRKKTRV